MNVNKDHVTETIVDGYATVMVLQIKKKEKHVHFLHLSVDRQTGLLEVRVCVCM